VRVVYQEAEGLVQRVSHILCREGGYGEEEEESGEIPTFKPIRLFNATYPSPSSACSAPSAESPKVRHKRLAVDNAESKEARGNCVRGFTQVDLHRRNPDAKQKKKLSQPHTTTGTRVKAVADGSVGRRTM
jgi:hypothetical protein